MLKVKEAAMWDNKRTSLGREIVLAERRTLYEWRVEDGSGDSYTVNISGGFLICSCCNSDCIHENVVKTMMGVA